MGRIVLKYWDCPQCGTKDISGSLRECPNCGKPRATGTTYHFKPNEKPVYVSEETAEKVRKRGRDWECQHCSSMNSGLDTVCSSCGAPKETTQSSKTSINTFDSTITSSRNKTADNLTTQNDTYTQLIKEPLSLRIIPFAAIGLVTLLIALIVILCQPKDVEFRITDMSWTYTIDIQKLTPVEESDWNLPPGARLKRTETEFHHYEQVFDHYEIEYKDVFDGYEDKIVGYKDLGNGYAEEIVDQVPKYHQEAVEVPVYRDEPVYATKYYYEIDKWLHERNITTSAHDKNPYWGEVILADKERENKRTEVYTLYGVGGDDTSYECKVDYNTWLICEKEDIVKGKLDIFGNFVIDTSTDTSENICIINNHTLPLAG